MASEDSRDGNANYDSRSEEAAVASVAAIPADYDSALSQLNMLDAPGQDVESNSEHSHEEAASCAISAAATDSDSAIALLSELCALVGPKAQEFDESGRVQDGSVESRCR